MGRTNYHRSWTGATFCCRDPTKALAYATLKFHGFSRMTSRFLQAQTASPSPSLDPARQAAERSLGLWDFMPFVVIAVLFYFILIAPQRKQQKQRDDMLKAIKKNDHVLTNGG